MQKPGFSPEHFAKMTVGLLQYELVVGKILEVRRRFFSHVHAFLTETLFEKKW